MKKLTMWSKFCAYKQHTLIIANCIVVGVLMLIIMPLKTFTQPVIIVGKTDAVCIKNDGEVKVQITAGVPNFTITITKGGSALQLTQAPVIVMLRH